MWLSTKLVVKRIFSGFKGAWSKIPPVWLPSVSSSVQWWSYQYGHPGVFVGLKELIHRKCLHRAWHTGTLSICGGGLPVLANGGRCLCGSMWRTTMEILTSATGLRFYSGKSPGECVAVFWGKTLQYIPISILPHQC